MNVLNFISQDNYIICNKTLIRALGTDAAVLIGHFASLQKHYDTPFYQTGLKIQEHTGLKKHTIAKTINTLKSKNILHVEKKGIPCKSYYWMDVEILTGIFNLEEEETCENPEPSKTDGQVSGGTENKFPENGKLVHTKTGNLHTRKQETINKINNNKINNNKINNNIYKKNYTKKRKTVPLEKGYDFFKNEFQEVWENEFIPMKKKKKASTSEKAIKRQLNKIQKYSGGNYDVALEILEKSVDSGWTDVYPLKNTQYKPNPGTSFKNKRKNGIRYQTGKTID